MLEIRQLRKSFHKRTVLKDISFSVRRGEVLCLLGNNGAGKTTILNCILRMIKADAGQILFDGKEIGNFSQAEYFSKVNALLESSSNVYDYLSGRQNIQYFAGLMKMDERSEKIERYVHLLELEKDLDKAVGEYSFGMKQKLALVIALMSSPSLLLLDEPTLGLDMQSKWTVVRLIKQLQETENMAIILTTHQMEVIQKMDSRILLLKDGQVCDFDKASYAEENVYTISFMEDNMLKQLDAKGSFQEIVAAYGSRMEIVEIRKKERELEEILMEALREAH